MPQLRDSSGDAHIGCVADNGRYHVPISGASLPYWLWELTSRGYDILNYRGNAAIFPTGDGVDFGDGQVYGAHATMLGTSWAVTEDAVSSFAAEVKDEHQQTITQVAPLVARLYREAEPAPVKLCASTSANPHVCEPDPDAQEVAFLKGDLISLQFAVDLAALEEAGIEFADIVHSSAPPIEHSNMRSYEEFVAQVKGHKIEL